MNVDAAPVLPPLLLLTDRHQASLPLAETVALAVGAGVRAVVLREKDLDHEARAALARELAPVLHDAGGILLAAGTGPDTSLPGGDGAHLPAAAGGDRPPGIVGRSCHDVDEIRAAERQGVDYVTVSPVFATRSKPDHGPQLGTAGLARLTTSTTLRVYALGGVETPAHARQCAEASAHGVAVMGALMRSTRPDRLAAELLAAVEGCP